MRKFGLIGRKLGHSLSQELFEAQGFKDACYGLYEMASLDRLRQWVEVENICGFNVTIPYKQEIIPMLDGLDDTAEEIGAVNCVSVENGRFIGHNTDAPAFMSTFEEPCNGTALILGTGGAARAVAYALRQLGVEYVFVSRKPESATVRPVIGYENITSDHKVIINATPVGMAPDVYTTPLKACHDVAPELVYDLIYNPSSTLLMKEAEACGAKAKNGFGMLCKQAELSWRIWGL